MDLASATDQLYAGSPDDFVERRKALVAEARAGKDRPLATVIGTLRRPTRSAWLVNLYARTRPEELTALLDLGAALQAAQEQLSAPDLRRLSAERHRAVEAATRGAVELGSAQGYAATEAVRQEVSDTLQAALADPEVAQQVRAGTVTQAQAYGGFGPFGLAPAPAAVQEPEPEPVAPDAVVPDDGSVQLRAAVEQRLLEAEAALHAAADDAARSSVRADELADRVATLRTRLAAAEVAEAEARDQERSAREAVTELELAVRAAQRAYGAL